MGLLGKKRKVDRLVKRKATQDVSKPNPNIVVIQWIPSHMGLLGKKTKVDRLVKRKATQDVSKPNPNIGIITTCRLIKIKL